MDEDRRTVWCGNLSEKVTEDLLYELFLQSGPIQKVSIPKDRDGKQRSYGFVTFRHTISVPYALDLFKGTALFDRVLTMKTRNNIERPPQAHAQLQTQQQPCFNMGNELKTQEATAILNNPYQLRHEISLGNMMPNVSLGGFYPGQEMVMYPSQVNAWVKQDDRRPPRGHPYQRDRKRERRDQRDRSYHKDRHSSHRSHDHSRNSDSRSDGRNYR
ncbi:RNA-binding protein 7-like [Athalia rosae]|uniref:RNA-binding protein 7-like n=1 Tax=Athalia rosae TaxID=37344 RepID=UPI002033235C|nr:RNA-binding protein 7-like [Athalia rosae]XP_048507400.1 RNA-binding protein 7-like [Athalia rosae]